MQAKKSLGQNFLMHPQIAERIVAASGVGKSDTVLEIGPGKGMLTRPLLAAAKKVIAVETDAELVAVLRETFAEEIKAGKLELIGGDIREFDFTLLPEKYALVANIPYYITGEIIRMFLEAGNQPGSMTLLVQKEVAERVARSKKESLLSLSIKAYGVPKYEFTVPRGAFRPAPGVDSAVLSVRGISRAHFADTGDEGMFFKLIHAGFAHKRKHLAKNLAEKGFSAGIIDAGIRAEDLSLADWLALVKSQQN